MKKRYLRALINVEFAAAAALTLVLTAGFALLSDILPEPDETSFLTPVFSRIDFLNIEDVSLDAIFAMKETEFADPRIVVVNIGEVAPAPDAKIAMLLYKLQGYGARAIGIDVFFDQIHFDRFPPERAGEADALRQALADVPNVVLVSGYDEASLRTTIRPDASLDVPRARMGFANLTPDKDGVVRRFMPYRTLADGRQESFPVRLAGMYDPALAARQLALPEEPQIIAYSGTYDQYQTVPIDDIIAGDEYAPLFRGAIVLVGFVNEGGLFYLNDTHKTPMGKRTVRYREDGSTEIGVEGPDMAGILIHANVVNMLLTHSEIRSVPVWGDWLIAFLFAYGSIALYCALRTRAASARGVGILITSTLIVETLIVFFLPIISFFFFDLKISYNLLASAVLLFIPSNALITKHRFTLLHRRARRWSGQAASSEHAPLAGALLHAFDDDNAFIANVRLQHAALRLVHIAAAIETAQRIHEERPLPESLQISTEGAWSELIPAIQAIFDDPRRRDEQLFLRFLAGRKLQLLRESSVKQQFLATQKQNFNEFVDFEEWELLLPYVLRLHRQTLAAYLTEWTFDADSGRTIPADGETNGVGMRVEEGFPAGADPSLARRLMVRAKGIDVPVRIWPLCTRAECKVHHEPELFVFEALVQRQPEGPLFPVYLGEGVACEPVLPAGTIAELTRILAMTRVLH